MNVTRFAESLEHRSFYRLLQAEQILEQFFDSVNYEWGIELSDFFDQLAFCDGETVYLG